MHGSIAQVDMFSKSLILVPIHLEVHWCLVTADIVKKRICLYDSQGDGLQKVARVTTDSHSFKITYFSHFSWSILSVWMYLKVSVKQCLSLFFGCNRTSWNTWWRRQKRGSKQPLKAAGWCHLMRYVALNCFLQKMLCEIWWQSKADMTGAISGLKAPPAGVSLEALADLQEKMMMIMSSVPLLSFAGSSTTDQWKWLWGFCVGGTIVIFQLNIWLHWLCIIGQIIVWLHEHSFPPSVFKMPCPGDTALLFTERHTKDTQEDLQRAVWL